MRRRTLLKASIVTAATSFIALPSSAKSRRTATSYIRTNWSVDPHSFGSYSFFAKDAKKSDYRKLGKPVGDRLFFAGEATHPEYNSTVHAAYESGLIAAKDILKTPAQSIGVVGAGMSGLAAADVLAKAGKEVVVVEARARIGGRIWTDDKLGVPLDLGASWIHGTDGNPLTDLATDLGVQTTPTDDGYVTRGGDGRAIPDDETPDWLDEVLSIQHSAGASSEEINSWAYWRDNDYDGDEVVFPLGYAQLFSTFSGQFDIRFNHQVSGVETASDGVILHEQNGLEIDFDAVVITVPLGVLKSGSIAFNPELPLAKRNAIKRLGMGVLDKVYLRYDEVFWDKDITWIATPENGLPQGQFNQWLNLYPYLKEPVIMAFNGAGPAKDLAKLSDKEVVDRAEQTLSMAYP